MLAIAAMAVSALTVMVGTAAADHATTTGQSFTFLQSGFTQDLVGTYGSFFGGVAFAGDGDPLVDFCQFGGSSLVRFDLQSTPPPVNGSNVHSASVFPSNAACGITNHPNGALYSDTSSGVVKLDPETGTQLAGPYGAGANALGIAVDPQTNNLVYVGSGGTLHYVTPDFSAQGTFSSVTSGSFVDGIAFDPTGNYLFTSNRTAFALTIVDHSGALVQNVPLSHEPDGISFHASSPKFVVTNNIDGTMTRFDFPADDYTLPPIQSMFASGGFRGDLTQTGPDGCIYLTQAGTRYDNGATSGDNSLVRICGGFAPPPGVRSADLSISKIGTPDPVDAGDDETYTLTVSNAGPNDASSVVVTDTLPAGSTFVSASPDCTEAAGTVTCTAATIASGSSATFTIVVKAGDGSSMTNTATVSAKETDPNPDNNSASVTTRIRPTNADLSIVKNGPALVQDDGTITYSIVVSNAGPGTAANVVLSDPLPAGETLVSATSTQGLCSGSVSCALGDLAAGASATVTITATVSSSASSITNTASVKSDTNDPDGANNSSSTTARVNHAPVCSGASGGPSLWPPNHRLVWSSITGATDADGNPIGITITGIRQDEPTNGLGDGDTAIDGVIGIGNSFAVRAERSGKGNGRVYHVYFTASDGVGGSCTGQIRIGVPHDLGPGGGPIDDGPLYDSTS